LGLKENFFSARKACCFISALTQQAYPPPFNPVSTISAASKITVLAGLFFIRAAIRRFKRGCIMRLSSFKPPVAKNYLAKLSTADLAARAGYTKPNALELLPDAFIGIKAGMRYFIGIYHWAPLRKNIRRLCSCRWRNCRYA
jgi:hypothetical protein